MIETAQQIDLRLAEIALAEAQARADSAWSSRYSTIWDYLNQAASAELLRAKVAVMRGVLPAPVRAVAVPRDPPRWPTQCQAHGSSPEDPEMTLCCRLVEDHRGEHVYTGLQECRCYWPEPTCGGHGPQSMRHALHWYEQWARTTEPYWRAQLADAAAGLQRLRDTPSLLDLREYRGAREARTERALEARAWLLERGRWSR